jgi:hypothetical protein
MGNKMDLKDEVGLDLSGLGYGPSKQNSALASVGEYWEDMYFHIKIIIITN